MYKEDFGLGKLLEQTFKFFTVTFADHSTCNLFCARDASEGQLPQCSGSSNIR
jgi:hypothetical protein